jgi:hypothetical protein
VFECRDGVGGEELINGVSAVSVHF